MVCTTTSALWSIVVRLQPWYRALSSFSTFWALSSLEPCPWWPRHQALRQFCLPLSLTGIFTVKILLILVRKFKIPLGLGGPQLHLLKYSINDQIHITYIIKSQIYTNINQKHINQNQRYTYRNQKYTNEKQKYINKKWKPGGGTTITKIITTNLKM